MTFPVPRSIHPNVCLERPTSVPPLEKLGMVAYSVQDRGMPWCRDANSPLVGKLLDETTAGREVSRAFNRL